MKLKNGVPICIDCGKVFTTKIVSDTWYMAHLCNKLSNKVKG